MHRTTVSLMLVVMVMSLQLCHVRSLPPDFFRVGRNAKRLVTNQLKRDSTVTHDDVISASCLFCGAAYGSRMGEACDSDDETTRICVTSFTAELRALARAKGW